MPLNNTKDYYVYSHIRNDNNQVFYVGKGRGKRCRSKQGRSASWHDIANNNGYTIKLIDKNLSEQRALNVERLTIALCNSFFNLTNIAVGGHGNSGWKHTNETKEKQRIGLINSYTPELKEVRRKWMAENKIAQRPEVREKMSNVNRDYMVGEKNINAMPILMNGIKYPTVQSMLIANNIGYSTYKYWKRHNKLNEHGIELLCH